MTSEQSPQEIPTQTEGAILATEFLSLKESEHVEGVGVFEHLERDLFNAGFSLAAGPEVVRTFNDTSLLCRSESFSRVMDLIVHSAPISITNRGDANMCNMAGGSGFRVAMQEGFSGSEVGGLVKTVISFTGDHLTQKDHLKKDNPLWNTKPETASTSLSGGGEVFLEDVRMVSFRFPTKYFPEILLSDSEKGVLEERGAGFIVRHYTRIT